MISERSYDSEDWNKDAENSGLQSQVLLYIYYYYQFIKM